MWEQSHRRDLQSKSIAKYYSVACFEILGIFLHWVCNETQSDAVWCSVHGSSFKRVLHKLFIDCLKDYLNSGIKGNTMQIQ